MTQAQHVQPIVNHLEDITCIVDKTQECLESLSRGAGSVIVHKDANYEVINTAALNDPKLSYKAVGLHYYMQTLMDKKHIGKRDLMTAHTDRKDSVTSGMRELIRNKYLYKVRITTGRGTIAGVVYVSCAVPTLIDEVKLQKGMSARYRELTEVRAASTIDCDVYNNLWDKVRKKTALKNTESSPTCASKNAPKGRTYKIYKKARKYNKNKPLSGSPPSEDIPQTPKNEGFQEKAEQNQTTVGKGDHGSSKRHHTSKLSGKHTLSSATEFKDNFPLINSAIATSIKKKLSGQSSDCHTTKLESKFDRNIMKPIFDTWRQQTKLPTHHIDPTTKLFIRTRVLVHKCLLGKGHPTKHSVRDIKEAIINYGWITDQPYTVFRTKHRPMVVSIDEFFKFSDYSKNIIADKNHPLHNATSWFDESKKGKTYLIEKYSARKKDCRPKLTELLTELLLKSDVLGFSDAHYLKNIDTNTLIGVSDQLYSFVTEHDYMPHCSEVYVKTIECMIHLLEEDKERLQKDIHVGFMTSEVYWQRLEQLMIHRGVLRTR